EEAREPRRLARALDDPAGLVHDEAERGERDGAGQLAAVRVAAPVRAARAGAGLRADARATRPLARRDHRPAARVVPAELRRAGRVRGAARDPPPSRGARP